MICRATRLQGFCCFYYSVVFAKLWSADSCIGSLVLPSMSLSPEIKNSHFCIVLSPSTILLSSRARAWKVPKWTTQNHFCFLLVVKFMFFSSVKNLFSYLWFSCLGFLPFHQHTLHSDLISTYPSPSCLNITFFCETVVNPLYLPT